MTHKLDDERDGSLAGEHNEFTRRMLLGGIAGAAGLAAVSPIAFGQGGKKLADEEDAFNSWDRTRYYKNNEMDAGKPWVAPKHGNFDLNKAQEAHLARLKIVNNLAGKRTYLPMVLRATAGRSEQPGAVMYAGYALFSWQLQVPDPKEMPGLPEGTAVQRGQYTCVYVDPITMKPVSQLPNPINGKIMPLADYLFVEQFLWFPNGGIGFVEEPEMFNDDPNKVKMPHVKEIGDDLILTGDGIYKNPGQHQPRFTMVMWRAPLADIMNPAVPLCTGHYSHMGVKKAYEKPWTGHTVEEDVILGTMANGKKVHKIEDIPDIHKRLILEKYPDRV